MADGMQLALFLGGIIAGTVGAGGVGAVQYARLEVKMEERYHSDHERLVKIENDVRWIREMLANNRVLRYNGEEAQK